MNIQFNLEGKKIIDICREYESISNSLEKNKIINIDYSNLEIVNFYIELSPRGIKYNYNGTKVDIENKNLLKVIEYSGFIIIDNSVVDCVIPYEEFSSFQEREDFLKAVKYLINLGVKEREDNNNKGKVSNLIKYKSELSDTSKKIEKESSNKEKQSGQEKQEVQAKKTQGNIILNYNIDKNDYRSAFNTLSRLLTIANLAYERVLLGMAIIIALTMMFYVIVALGTNNTELIGGSLLVLVLEIVAIVMLRNRVKKGYINKLMVENIKGGEDRVGLLISKDKIIFNKDGIVYEYDKRNLIQVKRLSTAYMLIIVGNNMRINPIIVPLRLFKNEKQKKEFKLRLKREVKLSRKEKITLIEKGIFGDEQLKKVKKVRTLRMSSLILIIVSPFIISLMLTMVAPNSNGYIGAMKVASTLGLRSNNNLDNLAYDSNSKSIYSKNVFIKDSGKMVANKILKNEAINSYNKAINVAIGDYQSNENSFIMPREYGENMIKNDKSINNNLVSFLPYSVQAVWQLGNDEEAFILSPKEKNYDNNIKYLQEGEALISQLNYMSPYYGALKEAYIDNFAMNNMVSENPKGMDYMRVLNNELLPSKAVEYLKESGKLEGESNAVFVGPTELENNKLFRLVFIGKINKSNFKLFKVYEGGQVSSI